MEYKVNLKEINYYKNENEVWYHIYFKNWKNEIIKLDNDEWDTIKFY